MKPTNDELKKLIVRLGGPSFVSRELNVTPQAVSLWVCRTQIPAERLSDLVKLGMKNNVEIDLQKIRPDIDWSLIAASVFSFKTKNGGTYV